jgi:hypothetical protein
LNIEQQADSTLKSTSGDIMPKCAHVQYPMHVEREGHGLEAYKPMDIEALSSGNQPIKVEVRNPGGSENVSGPAGAD